MVIHSTKCWKHANQVLEILTSPVMPIICSTRKVYKLILYHGSPITLCSFISITTLPSIN